MHACPALRPRPVSCVRPSERGRCCLPPGSRRRPRQFGSYEAESRGPHARCLRFAVSVTQNTTQDSLPAGGQPLLSGISPAGPQQKVSSHIMTFPLSQALLGARTILPSGPLSAIASFGSSEGHSLSVGPFDRVSLARRNTDTHLRGHAERGMRTLFAGAGSNDCLLIDSPKRAFA